MLKVVARLLRIQELNLDFLAKKDMTEMIEACFLKPQESETGQMMSNAEVLGILTMAFPSLKMMAGLSIKLGLAMKKLGFEQTHPHNVAHFVSLVSFWCIEIPKSSTSLRIKLSTD